MHGEFNSPVRVVPFNTAEGWSRDAENSAEEILQRFSAQAEYHSAHLDAFLNRHAAGKPLQLPLRAKGRGLAGSWTRPRMTIRS